MPAANDRQTSFLGGMRDNISPEMLGPDEFAFALNMELRQGRPETRRGSFRWLEDIAGEEFQGAGIFKDLVNNIEYVMVAQGDNIYRIGQNQQRVKMPTPDPLGGAKVRFLQALDKLYIFRGEGNPPFRWTGNVNEVITLVPGATTPTLSDMPGSDRVLFLYNRFWVITGTDTLNISDDLSEEFDLTNNSFKVTQGDGQRLTKIVGFGAGKLIALKERSIALISNANNFSTAVPDLTLEFIDSEVGCDAQDTVVNVGKDIFFKSSRGFHSLIQTSEQNAQLVDVPLSEPIDKLFRRIGPVNVDRSQAVLFDNYYLPAVPIDEATQPSAIMAFDLEIKRWVGLWTIKDNATTDDDGLFKVSRLLVKDDPRQKLMMVGEFGAVGELLRGRHEDLVPSNNFGMIFISANSPRLEIDDMFGAGGIASQSAGQISMKITIDGGLGLAASVLEAGRIVASEQLLWQITPVQSVITGGPINTGFAISFGPLAGFDWRLVTHTGTDSLEVGRTYDLRLVQDGVSPKIFIDGVERTDVTFDFTTDLTAWWSKYTFTRMHFGKAVFFGLNSASMTLRQIKLMGATGFDDIIGSFPLNEGTGETVTGYKPIAGKAVATFTGNWTEDVSYNQWTSVTAASALSSQITTRGYSFGALHLYKQIVRGLIEVVHMDPSLTINLLNNEAFDDEVLQAAVTFSETEYETHNQADWVNTNVNDDFQTPFRGRYAPVTFPSAGLTIGANGVTLSQDRDRSFFVRSDAIAKWFQLDLQSTRDMFGLVGATLDAQTNNLATLRDF